MQISISTRELVLAVTARTWAPFGTAPAAKRRAQRRWQALTGVGIAEAWGFQQHIEDSAVAPPLVILAYRLQVPLLHCLALRRSR